MSERAHAGPRVGLADAYPHLRGGAQVQARLVATAWHAQGIDVRLVVPGTGPLPREVATAGVATMVVPTPGTLRRYGRRTRPTDLRHLPGHWARARHAFVDRDVAHLHDHRGVLLYGPAARAAGAAVVWHVHATAAGPALDRACAALAATIVVPTAAVAERFTGLGRVTVVPGVVPPPGVHWRPEGPPRVVTVGRVFPSKGLDTLVDAVAVLRRRVPDVHLDVIGAADPADDGTARRLREQVAARGLGDVVTFHGHLDDPWPVAARAHVYVQASRSGETQGLALRQARMVGLPTVATASPAWADLPEGAPARVPVDDARAMAQALQAGLDGHLPAPAPHDDPTDPATTAAALRAVHLEVAG